MGGNELRLTNNQVSQVKQNADLLAIIEAAGTELRPAGGGRLKGLCPFHSEKTASFIVYRDQGRYHCFGCGENGDVIDFIQKQRGLSFPDALKVLGADDWRPSAPELRATQARQRREKAQRRRERDLAYTFGHCYQNRRKDPLRYRERRLGGQRKNSAASRNFKISTFHFY